MSQEYSQRESYYSVNGIPHSQWDGIENTTGGYPDGNWQPMYNQFLPIYNSLITNNTPYSLEISGSVESSNVSYNVLVALDVDFPSSNNTVHVFVTEDNIDSYWIGAATNHDARNVARIWEVPTDIYISSEGETQLVTGAFDISSSWVQSNIKITAIVQNNVTKEILQSSSTLIDDMNADLDEDGINYYEDNCPDIYNPNQSDIDNDQMGDACDLCDNENIWIFGNLNGDQDISGKPVINILDVLMLVDMMLSGDFGNCAYEIANINNDNHINLLDVITLVQLLLNENFINHSQLEFNGSVFITDEKDNVNLNIISRGKISGVQFELSNIADTKFLENLSLPVGWIVNFSNNSTKTNVILFDATGINSTNNIQLSMGNIKRESIKNILVGDKTGNEINIKFLDKEKDKIYATNYSISNIYPNPFNPSLSIDVKIFTGTSINMTVYNLLGEKVDTILDKNFLYPGSYTFLWNAKDHESGTYFIQTTTLTHKSTRKVALIK